MKTSVLAVILMAMASAAFAEGCYQGYDQCKSNPAATSHSDSNPAAPTSNPSGQ